MTSADRLRIFEGAVGIITGGASGIGQALAEALARRGATVVLADLQIDKARKVAAGIEAGGGKATVAEGDVCDFEAVNRIVETTVNTHGRLDYMFNNAGIGIGGEVRSYGIQDWQRVLNVNLFGVVNGVQAAYPVMLRQGFGHVINTASMAGLVPSPGIVSYSTAKHAVVGLSLALRVEAAAAGIRVSVLCPGVIRTPILEGVQYANRAALPNVEKLRAYWERFRPLDPEKFAPRVLKAVARNRAIIIVPAWWKIFWWLHRLSPWLGERLARRNLADMKATLVEPADAGESA
jgi:NAD(P)-dependent dehydrogenase (short-subunit alcohol dehydrogenase family)